MISMEKKVDLSCIKLKQLSDQSGAVIVLVLSILAVIIVLAGNFSLAVRRDSEVVNAIVDGVQLRYSADSGIQYALYAIRDEDKERVWETDGRPYQVTIDGIPVTVRVLSEAGKFDINKASEEMFTELFTNTGLEEEAAKRLAKDVLYWRSGQQSVDIVDVYNDDDYEADGRQIPAHRSFLSIEEIGQVMGMTSAVFSRIKPLITIYGNQKIDLLSASTNLMVAMGLTAEQAAAVIVARELYYETEEEIDSSLLEGNEYFTIGRKTTYYRILAQAKVGEQKSTRFAVVKGQRDSGEGVYRELMSGAVMGGEEADFFGMTLNVEAETNGE